MKDIFDKLRCFIRGHVWKHYRIVSEYDDNRCGPPNKETIERKCLSCGKQRIKVVLT